MSSRLPHYTQRHRLSTALFAVLVASAGQAAAQSENGVAPGTTDLDKVTVTGSRIARTGFVTPSPVTAISAEEIRATGATTISDLMHACRRWRRATRWAIPPASSGPPAWACSTCAAWAWIAPWYWSTGVAMWVPARARPRWTSTRSRWNGSNVSKSSPVAPRPCTAPTQWPVWSTSSSRRTSPASRRARRPAWPMRATTTAPLPASRQAPTLRTAAATSQCPVNTASRTASVAATAPSVASTWCRCRTPISIPPALRARAIRRTYSAARAAIIPRPTVAPSTWARSISATRPATATATCSTTTAASAAIATTAR